MKTNQELSGLNGARSTSYRRKALFAIIILFVLVFSAYANSLDCSWQFDDDANITNNKRLHLEALSWDQLIEAVFSNQKAGGTFYRPVAFLSFAVNYYFGKLNVFGYHLTNLFIHFAASVVLSLFIYHTLNLPSLRATYASRAYAVALPASILWAINPVQTQAVTYIVQRMTSMAGLFYILSMYLYLKARMAEKRGEKFSLFLVSFAAFALAFGSKENAVLLPMSVFLYETLLIQENPRLFLRRNMKWFLLAGGLTLALGVAYLGLRGEGIVAGVVGGYEHRPFSLVERLLTEVRVVVFYISLLIYPIPNRLNIAHGIQISNSLFDPISTFFAVLFITAAIVALLLLTRRYPLFSFCYLFFFLNHSLESTILPLELIHEHRNYIPSMFFFVPVAAGFHSLLDRFTTKKHMRYITSAFVILLILGLAHATSVRNDAWKSRKSLWIDATKKAPDQSRAHHNLGACYQEQGHFQEAISEYEKALRSPGVQLNKQKAVTYYNLGKLYTDLGDTDKAKFYYESAVEKDPGFYPALNGLVLVYDEEGRVDLAHAYLKKAYELNSEDSHVNFNMGIYWLKQRCPEKAICHFVKSVGDEGVEKEAFLYLGIAYKQKGSLEKAVVYFRKSLAGNPKDITPRLHLLEIYHETGDELMSRKEAERIARIMVRERGLLDRTVTLISQKGRSGDVQLSASIILPLLYGALKDQRGGFGEWEACMKKILEKQEDNEIIY